MLEKDITRLVGDSILLVNNKLVINKNTNYNINYIGLDMKLNEVELKLEETYSATNKNFNISILRAARGYKYLISLIGNNIDIVYLQANNIDVLHYLCKIINKLDLAYSDVLKNVVELTYLPIAHDGFKLFYTKLNEYALDLDISNYTSIYTYNYLNELNIFVDYLFVNDTRYDDVDGLLELGNASHYTVSLNAKDKNWYLIEYKTDLEEKYIRDDNIICLCSSLSRVNYMDNIVSIRKLDKTFSDCKEPSVDVYADKVTISYNGSTDDIISINKRDVVFIGGSISIKSLDNKIKEKLDSIIDKGYKVVIGDANGVDSLVQGYLNDKGYRDVVVYYTNDKCRNNIGNWESKSVESDRSLPAYLMYQAKDKAMSEVCDIGFMLWDGVSRGTKANIERLASLGKGCVVFNGSDSTIRYIK